MKLQLQEQNKLETGSAAYPVVTPGDVLDVTRMDMSKEEYMVTTVHRHIGKCRVCEIAKIDNSIPICLFLPFKCCNGVVLKRVSSILEEL